VSEGTRCLEDQFSVTNAAGRSSDILCGVNTGQHCKHPINYPKLYILFSVCWYKYLYWFDIPNWNWNSYSAMEHQGDTILLQFSNFSSTWMFPILFWRIHWCGWNVQLQWWQWPSFGRSGADNLRAQRERTMQVKMKEELIFVLSGPSIQNLLVRCQQRGLRIIRWKGNDIAIFN